MSSLYMNKHHKKNKRKAVRRWKKSDDEQPKTDKHEFKEKLKDFTIDDSANSVLPVVRLKKSSAKDILSKKLLVVNAKEETSQEWDDELDDIPISESPINNDCVTDTNNNETVIYPEILWYLISIHIKPEQIKTFACINRITYSITKKESFWRNIYNLYCIDQYKLPDVLKSENNFSTYGLRQRVIRSLFYTYEPFVEPQKTFQLKRLNRLVKMKCINMWFKKCSSMWLVYFKFKMAKERVRDKKTNFFNELSKVDANSEEDCHVLELSCLNVTDRRPLIGLTLISIHIKLAKGFKNHNLTLGFTSSNYNISKDIIPDHHVKIDDVVSINIYEWWDQKYPHSENKVPENSDEPLMQDFFSDDWELLAL